ncbi:MAG: hypothetical protein LBP59_20135, partial [Planctomycetaceae bacterium]|nr:hypothetical protein [Planctomycetaceae bacterium]
MKTIFRVVLYYFTVVLSAVYFCAGTLVEVYSQDNTSTAMKLPDDIQRPIKIPKYPVNKPLPHIVEFETHVYSNVFFYESIFPDDYKVDINHSFNKKRLGYHLKL